MLKTLEKDYVFPSQEYLPALQKEMLNQYADKICDAVFADLEVLWKHAREHGLPHPHSEAWAGCQTGEGGYTEVGHNIPDFGQALNKVIGGKLYERLQGMPDRNLYRLGQPNWGTRLFLHKRIYHA